jgi:hypothetical protein
MKASGSDGSRIRLKSMKPLIALMLSTVGLCAQVTTNLPFTWDAGVAQPPGSHTGWKFYEKVSGTRVLLGGTTGETNRFFTVNNFVLGSFRTFVVTSTNMNGESAESVPFVSPVLPAPPTDLRPVTSTMVSPVPGVIEISEDLVNWSQRIVLAQTLQPNSVNVQLVQYPRLPMLFMRLKAPYTGTTIPIPTRITR